MIYDSSNGETQPQYLGLTSKAADSDKLDGKDSSEFASSSHNHTASNVAFTPSGKIAATNVQSAIEEVDTAATNADNARLAIQADLALKAAHGYTGTDTVKTLKEIESNLLNIIYAGL